MKPATRFELAWRHKPWRPRQLRWMPAGGQAGVPVWRDPSAFRFDTLNAKHFADALMIDRMGITIPPVAQKVEPA